MERCTRRSRGQLATSLDRVLLLSSQVEGRVETTEVTRLWYRTACPDHFRRRRAWQAWYLETVAMLDHSWTTSEAKVGACLGKAT